MRGNTIVRFDTFQGGTLPMAVIRTLVLALRHVVSSEPHLLLSPCRIGGYRGQLF